MGNLVATTVVAAVVVAAALVKAVTHLANVKPTPQVAHSAASAMNQAAIASVTTVCALIMAAAATAVRSAATTAFQARALVRPMVQTVKLAAAKAA